jgi:hypothetical protein
LTVPAQSPEKRALADRIDGEARDVGGVVLEAAHLLERLAVPHAHRVVPAAREETIGRLVDGERVDGVGVALERADQLHCGEVPHADRLVGGAGEELVAG